MSAIEISKISFISRGFSRARLKHSSSYTTTFRVWFYFTFSRLNPLLMKLILLIWSGA